MVQPQLYKVIGIPILIALIISGIMIFLSSAIVKYDVTGYDNETLQKIRDSGNSFNNIVQTFDNETTDLSSDDLEIDKEGNIINQVISAFKTITQSYSNFDALLDSSLDRMRLGTFGRILKYSILSLIILMFVLGIGMTIYLRVRV